MDNLTVPHSGAARVALRVRVEPLSQARTCLEHADECMRLAAESSDQERRIQLIEVAAMWHRLADQVEQHRRSRRQAHKFSEAGPRLRADQLTSRPRIVEVGPTRDPAKSASETSFRSIVGESVRKRLPRSA